MLLSIKVFFKLLCEIFYGIKFKLINQLGLYPWVYGRDLRKYRKVKAYYKKLGKSSDEDD